MRIITIILSGLPTATVLLPEKQFKETLKLLAPYTMQQFHVVSDARTNKPLLLMRVFGYGRK